MLKREHAIWVANFTKVDIEVVMPGGGAGAPGGYGGPMHRDDGRDGPHRDRGGGHVAERYVVRVENRTDGELTLESQEHHHCVPGSRSPRQLAAGATASIEYLVRGGKHHEGPTGTLIWRVGGGAGGPVWNNHWMVPRGDEPNADGSLAPSTPGLQAGAKAIPVDDGAGFVFTLSGKTQAIAGKAGPGSGSVGGAASGGSVAARANAGSGKAAAGTGAAEAPSAGGQTAGAMAAGAGAAATGTGTPSAVGEAAGAMAAGTGAAATGAGTPPAVGEAAGAMAAGTGGAAKGTGTPSAVGQAAGTEAAGATSAGKSPADGADDSFAPPAKSKQPTLRKGDDSPDGWVEYAQGLLNRWLTDHKQSKLTVDGKFGPAMDKAVRAFQAASKTMVDGIIGNQTWSLLREGKKDSIGTDGQKPHSFEQKNAQGRFTMEGPDRGGYHRPEDMFFMWIVSTGEQPIDDYHVTVKVTLPDGKSHTHKTKIGPVRKKSDDGQGNFHRFEVKSFTKAFRLDENKAAPIDPPTCTVDAYLDKEIGGDRWSGPITEYK